MRTALCILGIVMLVASAAAAEMAQGVVYNDVNGNCVRDGGEKGISGVGVSNGREVVRTDKAGRWQLPADDDTIFFVIKPSGWMTPLSEDNLPLFYYIHRPQGSPNAPAADIDSVRPTGAMPVSIDFPLHKQKEPKRFRVLFFGDTQINSMKELDYLSHDIIGQVIGTDAVFGVSLGDNVGDSPELHEPLIEAVGTVGIPWYNTIGNHDSVPGVRDNSLSDDIWERYYGPSNYAFEYGGVSFIVLDSVFVKPDKGYEGRFTEEQLAFVKNYLEDVPRERLVVLTMHIPLRGVKNVAELFAAMGDRPNSLSLAAHTHTIAHTFFDQSQGWQGAKPHHQFINGTTCGSWWAGLRDEADIPHSTMNDGSPNGYAFVTFDVADYSIQYQPARRPADHQMNIYAPDEVLAADAGATEVLVNVFAGSERSIVEMSVDGGAWSRLQQTAVADPQCVRMNEENKFNEKEALGYKFDKPRENTHMWKGLLPAGLVAGAHTVEVRTVDMFGQTYNAHRLIRVK